MVGNITSICAVIIALFSLAVTCVIFYKNTSPEVIAYLKTGKDKAKSVIYLEVQNIGNGFARNVHIRIDENIRALAHLRIKEINFLFLQPNASVEYLINVGYEAIKLPPFEVNVSYELKVPVFRFYKKKEHVFILDAKSFAGIDSADNSNLAAINSTLVTIVHSMKEINKSIINLRSDSK